MQKISNIIAENSQKGMKISMLHDKLATAISKFDAPCRYGETPISRLKMLQAEIMMWNNPETEPSEKPSAARLDNPKTRCCVMQLMTKQMQWLLCRCAFPSSNKIPNV